MKKRNEIKSQEITTRIINDEIIESVDNRLSNKVIPSRISVNGPLSWKEIIRFQPEKEEVLRSWFNETGYWPVLTSTPGFDITTGVVYPSYSLDEPTDGYGIQTYLKIKNCVMNKTPAHWQ